MNIQPVVPVTVGDWNLVNRASSRSSTAPARSRAHPGSPTPSPAMGPPASATSTTLLYFSPVETKGHLGHRSVPLTCPRPPTANWDLRKWSTGPRGCLFQPGWGTYGGLVRQLWSFAGDSDRASVNQTLIEPFLNYNLPDGWYLVTDMVIPANWQADSGNRWTVPLGGGVGKLLKIGSQAINVRTEAYYNVEKPDSAPDWQWGFTVQFLFPK